MKVKYFLEMLIYLNLIEVVDSGAAVLFTFFLSATQPSLLPLILVMFSTFFLYGLNRINDVKEDRINSPERLNFWKRYGKKLIFIGSLLFIISLTISAFNNIFSFILLLLPFLLVFSYSCFRLKRFLFIKNLIVATGWFTIPFFTATLMSSFSLSIILVCSIIIFFAVLINTVIFDIKDIKGDEIHNIRTISNVFGIHFAKKISYLLNILLSSFIIFVSLIYPKFIVFLFLPLFITAYVIKVNKSNAFFISEYVANIDILLILILSLVSVMIW